MATARKSVKSHNRKPHTRTVTKKYKGGTTTKTVQVKGSHVRRKK